MTCPHEAWAKLRESGKGDGRLEIASYPAPVQTGYGPIRFALGSENEARILIPCASVQAGVRAESSVNLKLRVAEYRGPAGRQAYLDLICQDKSLEMVFSELASEIMRRVSI